MESNMFCYQCQETAGCTGCTRVGVCGKQPEVAALQDLLVYVTKGMSAVTTQLRAEGTPVDPETNHWVTLNLFLTITNANFDGPALRARVQDTLDRKAVLLAQVQDPSCLPEAAHWTGPQAVFADKAARVGVLSTQDEDVRSLRELITYGLKGLAAYTKHANALGQEDPGDRTVRRDRHGAAGPGQHHRLRPPGDHQSVPGGGNPPRHSGLRP